MNELPRDWRPFGPCVFCKKPLLVANPAESPDQPVLKHADSGLSFGTCWNKRRYAPMRESMPTQEEAE